MTFFRFSFFLNFSILVSGLLSGCVIHAGEPYRHPGDYKIEKPQVEVYQRTDTRETRRVEESTIEEHSSSFPSKCVNYHRIHAGSDFQQGKEWKLCSGDRLIFQQDGNLVLYGRDDRARWASGTHGRGGTRLRMQQDGNWVIYTASNTPIWSTGTHGNQDSYLVFSAQSVSLYTSARELIWDSRNADVSKLVSQCDSFQRINGGADFRQGKTWKLCSGDRLIFQQDGNLVLYDRDDRARWASGTHGRGGTRLSMQQDGNLVIYTASNTPIWATGTHGNQGSYLVFGTYGLSLYNPERRLIWENK